MRWSASDRPESFLSFRRIGAFPVISTDRRERRNPHYLPGPRPGGGLMFTRPRQATPYGPVTDGNHVYELHILPCGIRGISSYCRLRAPVFRIFANCEFALLEGSCRIEIRTPRVSFFKDFSFFKAEIYLWRRQILLQCFQSQRFVCLAACARPLTELPLAQLASYLTI